MFWSALMDICNTRGLRCIAVGCILLKYSFYFSTAIFRTAYILCDLDLSVLIFTNRLLLVTSCTKIYVFLFDCSRRLLTALRWYLFTLFRCWRLPFSRLICRWHYHCQSHSWHITCDDIEVEPLLLQMTATNFTHSTLVSSPNLRCAKNYKY